MFQPTPVTRDIVLVGGGHAHVDVIKRFGMRPEPGVRVTLVARDVLTPYSGMIPGLLRGVYTPRECHIDLGRLCRWAGVDLIRAPVEGLDLVAQDAFIEGRPPLAFDLLSLDVGSTPPKAAIDGADAHALPIKPLDQFLARLEAMDREIRDDDAIVVVGAGAGGVEAAIGLKRRFERLDRRPDVTLVSSEPYILPGHSDPVRRRMTQALADAGVAVRLGARVARIEPEAALLDDGERLPATTTVLTTGAAAAPWLAASGLAVDDGGFVKVDAHLRSISHPDVFAAGDCAAFQPRRLPKSGVYAVRQGPPLAANLRRAALGEALEPWKPQPVTLSLMSTGDEGAIVSYGKLAASGAWAWTWKDWIDRRWMRNYAELPPMKPVPQPVDPESPPPPMRCGGCGAKVASTVLRRSLARLGLEAAGGDDAARISPPEGKTLLQTVDQFKSIVDDPFLFGEIATVHALGDIYAMGAEPHSALATVILPHAGERAQERDLTQVLAGVQTALNAAGATLAGGHTGEGAELSLGLSLNGFADASAITPKGGAEAGDLLLLTKPIGVGAIMAADMRGEAAAEDVAKVIEHMRQPSAEAARILREAGAHALTDVTGFGLAGHLIEMADSSGLAAELRIADVPLLSGALETVQSGVESTMAPANAAFSVRIANLPNSAPGRLLFDPQTSGGLLAAVPSEAAERAVAGLHAAGYPEACVIGRLKQPTTADATISVVG